MYLSERERDRRYDQLRKMMAKEDIAAFLVVGNNCRGGGTGTGSFRYLTDYFMIYYYGLLLFLRDEDPILLIGSELQHFWAKKYSWIRDIRVSPDLATSAAQILLEKGLMQGKIGIEGMESISAAAYFSISERVPHAKFFDASPLFFSIRLKKEEAERELLEKAARINDEAYQEVLKHIRPGIREYEVVGILEGYHRGNGADQTFNLISSGPFPTSAEGTAFPGHLWYPGDREIQEGDCIHLEMTAAYGGYWNQLVRMIPVRRESPGLVRFHRAALSAIRGGLEKWERGTKTSDLVRSVAAATEKEGFSLGLPMGHFIGLDLMEGRLSPDSQVVLDPGITAVIHPGVMNGQGIRFVWGQTYFIADDGPRRLNQTDDSLLIV
jgi:Xaa-Pro aminopeptidase